MSLIQRCPYFKGVLYKRGSTVVRFRFIVVVFQFVKEPGILIVETGNETVGIQCICSTILDIITCM